MTFTFRNRKIFWDILKWNRVQKKWDGGNIMLLKQEKKNYNLRPNHSKRENKQPDFNSNLNKKKYW